MMPDLYVPPDSFLMVCAPMSGRVLKNFPALNRACATLREAGFATYSPYEGEDPAVYVPPSRDSQQAHGLLYRDLIVAGHPLCDGLVLLPGWENSYGCTREATVAQWLGKVLFRYDLERPGCPGNQITRRVQPTWSAADMERSLAGLDTGFPGPIR